MKRHELEHVIRASAAITGATEIVVIGSQAVHGSTPGAPDEVSVSMEADVFTFRSPDDAALIDGSIGEESPFHRTFGYYAHGVGPETAVLPEGWRDRLVALQTPRTGGATGLCLEVHDLAVSKLVAGREKDVAFCAALIEHGLVSVIDLRARLAVTPIDDARRRAFEDRLARLAQRRA